MKEGALVLTLQKLKNEKLRTRWIHYYQTFKELTPILHNLLPKNVREKITSHILWDQYHLVLEALKDTKKKKKKKKITDQYLQTEKFSKY